MQTIANYYLQMRLKVYVLVKDNDVFCYHNLKQLCDNNKDIPYYTVYRRLQEHKSITINSYIIGVDTIQYTTKRTLPNSNKEW